jgi:hypothetical protein
MEHGVWFRARQHYLHVLQPVFDLAPLARGLFERAVTGSIIQYVFARKGTGEYKLKLAAPREAEPHYLYLKQLGEQRNKHVGTVRASRGSALLTTRAWTSLRYVRDVYRTVRLLHLAGAGSPHLFLSTVLFKWLR